MAWEKGTSGNAKGRPKGTGKHQRDALITAHERVVNLRLKNVLNMIDEKQKVVDDYLAGSGIFAFLTDDGARLVELDLEEAFEKTTINKKPKPLDLAKVKFKFM